MDVKSVFELIQEISNSKQIDINTVKENLEYAFEKAYLKEFPDVVFKIKIDIDSKKIKTWEEKKVIDDSLENEDMDDDKEISLRDALKISSKAKVGDIIEIPISINSFDRRVAMHIKQLFDQKISEQSNAIIFENWRDRIGQNILAEVENINTGYIEVNLDGVNKGALLNKNQIPGEKLEIGKKYLFCIEDVKQQTKGWPIILSRTSEKLIENLLREYIPEISSGIIEIKAIARIPGFKTKIAVRSTTQGIDPIGTCVGLNGARIKEINSKVMGEFIDIILWNDDPKQFLVNACAPENLIGVEITNDEDSIDGLHKYVTLVVEKQGLPKIIGKSGQNIRLISKLTKWSIDAVDEQTAIEDKIEFEVVSHLNPTKPESQRPNINNVINNHQQNRNKKIEKKPVEKIVIEKPEEQYVNTYNKYENVEITDEDIESLINFNSVPKKEKPVNFQIDFEDIYESREEKSSSGPKHKKSKPKNKLNISKDTNNLLEEFGDIDNFLLEENNTSAKEIGNEEIGSDNLELDEE